MEFIKPGRQFDFMSKRRYFIGGSVLLLVLSIVTYFVPGLRLGTDFRGGTEIEVALKQSIPTTEIRHAVERAGFESPEVIEVTSPGTPNRVMIRVLEVNTLTEGQKQAVRQRLCLVEEGEATADPRCASVLVPTEIRFSPGGDKISLRYESNPDLAAIEKQIEGIEGITLQSRERGVVLANERDHKVDIHLRSKGDLLLDGLRHELGADKVPEQALRVEWIGPKAGAQLRDAAIKSVLIALIFIMGYIALRFDLRFAPGGIVALVHDVGIALGAMAITQREITISTVAAMLTIVGYSINDTVIVYDRIRENLPRHRGLSFAAIINLSISEMLGRTIITSGVTALSMLAFLWWGTGMIKDFAFALLVGIAVGTYSSIYIAAPLTEWIDKRFFGGSAVQRRAPKRTKQEKRAHAVV
ncbi:protein translocase subunit SecF [Polyangium fumosum]|uniref:Protein-export membrane protein SecF n=2 Tax=Polyangium fumosum TaxID=889272 RepID=A0A4U1J9L0_9BACT|nr:protein translocase subunit SecF [Polyangium fumosum]